jgi:glycosyltransferase involved in cell wall biosynthesis
MRKLAHGTISYTYNDMRKARRDLPDGPVWVAPNALYPRAEIVPAEKNVEAERNEILYVGRFVETKKVDLLIQGFAIAAKSNASIRLRLVGGGQAASSLQDLVSSHGIIDRVSFDGWVEGADSLRSTYSRAFCSVSPGFAGLGLTQSLGFGVPMIVADAEPHSPEIELADSGGVTWFRSDSPHGLATAINDAWARRDKVPDFQLSEKIRSRYSAESMADGIIYALLNTEHEGKVGDWV